MLPPRIMVPSVMGLLVCLAISTGCGRPGLAPPPADLVATVDGMPITLAELERELNLSGAKGRTNAQQVLEEFIQRERLVARARRLGLESDPEIQRGWKNLLIAKLKERELEPRLRNASVSQEDLHGAASRGAESALPSDEVRLAILRVELRPKASLAKRNEAMERISAACIKAHALAPGTVGFGPLAAEYSDDEATRLQGGDLGWLTAEPDRYNLQTNVLAAGFLLKAPGEISPIIAGNDGFYLVRLISRRAASRPKQQAEQLARHHSQLEQRRAIEADFAEETRRQIPVTLDTAAVRRIAFSRFESTPESQPSSSPRPPKFN